MRNARHVANQGDDANAAANPAAPANNAQNEANIIDNQPSLNNRIQRVRLMICLAKAIKNCRPWMDLGLFWMQILSMVGRNDPLMIVSVNEYDELYATQTEMIDFLVSKECFSGARYMTLNEYKLHLIRCEMNGDDDDDEEEEEVDVDMDFELCPDHEYIKAEEADDFYPKQYPLIMEDRNVNESQLFAFHKLRVEKLRNYFVSEYDATLPPNLCVSLCRYRGQFQGGCWGRVIGRIVYSNCDYEQHGNYPCEVLFSCEAHSNEDFTDDALDKCQSCERLFRNKSMLRVNNLICKTCYDSKKLQEKCIWVNLNKKGFKSFNFSHVVQYTLNVADRRNLPKTLKSYGKIRAELTYEMKEDDEEEEEEEEEKEAAEIYSRVSVNTFWENNQVRISGMMDKFGETLRRAQSRKATRAILVYADEIEEEEETKYIEILADPGVLFDGLDGVDYIFLTVSAWTQFYSILCP
eukprot:522733_1